MKMKKILAVTLALLMVVTCFAACGKKEETNKNQTKTDMEYVKEKGTLVVGITEFEPMDYKDEKGNWIGFDADMATAFAKYLGVDVKFVEIDWDSKEAELDGKTLDCVWNGMTLTDEVKSAMETSKPYFNNAQVVIVSADKAEQYKTAADCKELQFAVEAGSAGEKAANENGFKITQVKDQATALQEVAAGTCDAAIIDFLMALVTIGEGTSYSNLAYTASLSTEEYGVGFRKGSDLAAELNKFFSECIANGEMQKTAEKYGVQDYLIK